MSADGRFDTERLEERDEAPSPVASAFPLPLSIFDGDDDDAARLREPDLLLERLPPPAVNNAGFTDTGGGAFAPALAEALSVMCELRGSVCKCMSRLSVDTGRCASVLLPSIPALLWDDETDVDRAALPSPASSPDAFFAGDGPLLPAGNPVTP